MAAKTSQQVSSGFDVREDGKLQFAIFTRERVENVINANNKF